MFFLHRMTNAVTMMYNEADELTACHFIRPSTYWKRQEEEKVTQESQSATPAEGSIDQNEPS